jgi:hypothetical protein
MDERELVCKAILSRTTGDCEWKEQSARRVRSDAALKGLTPEGIKVLLRNHVAEHGCGVIDQRAESRGHEQPFWYRVIVPVEEFTHGLFVEMVLTDDDPDAPAVQIVNAHEQRR